MQFGGISTSSGTTGTTNQIGIDTLHWEKVTGFEKTTPANGLGVSAGGDELEINQDGIYLIFFQIGFTGSQATQFEFALLINDVVTPNQTGRRIAGVSAMGSCSIGTPIECKAGDRIAVGCRADNAGKEITVLSAQLMAMNLGT